MSNRGGSEEVGREWGHRQSRQVGGGGGEFVGGENGEKRRRLPGLQCMRRRRDLRCRAGWLFFIIYCISRSSLPRRRHQPAAAGVRGRPAPALRNLKPSPPGRGWAAGWEERRAEDGGGGRVGAPRSATLCSTRRCSLDPRGGPRIPRRTRSPAGRLRRPAPPAPSRSGGHPVVVGGLMGRRQGGKGGERRGLGVLVCMYIFT
jgi:hypothetical protein